MLFNWLKARKQRRKALQEAADEWIARHGRFARSLASWRSMDAYLLGDLEEQERWGKIRELIDERRGRRRRLSREKGDGKAEIPKS